MTDARTAVAAILKRSPSQSLAVLRVLYGHHRSREDLDHRLEALRDAGMPEWPHDFHGRPEDRLDGAAIRTLAFGKTWIGHQHSGVPFVMQMSASGDFAQRAQTNMVVGKVTLEGDFFCTQSSASLLGRKFCSPVYRNPGGSSEKQNEYIFANSSERLVLLRRPVRRAQLLSVLALNSFAATSGHLLSPRAIASPEAASKSSSRPSFPENR